MKNQYFGDINDYFKLGLLRALREGSGLRPGIAWMLTADDGRRDGSRTGYLERLAWRVHDPALYDELAELRSRGRRRHVSWVRVRDLVTGARVFERRIPAGPSARAAWLRAALRELGDCPLVFFDPDNGFEVKSVRPGWPGAEKFLGWDEARSAWDAGHSLLVYQHYPRRPRDVFTGELVRLSESRLPGARVTCFSTAHVLFLLAARPEHRAALARGVGRARTQWEGVLSVSESGARERADVLARICRALVEEGEEAAANRIARDYPFTGEAATARATSRLDSLRLWVRDGFLDRYDGRRLVFPGTLHVLSALLPGRFPYHPNWKRSQVHPAWWDLTPTVDHVLAVARGGADAPGNQVTTSQINNSRKGDWTLEELRWKLRDGGRMAEWDGLTGWFREMLAARPALGQRREIREWARLLDRVLPPSRT